MISDKNFADWEANAFGFGYGTGEVFVITALHMFLKITPARGSFDYQELQEGVGHAEAWLLINLLCHQRMIEYGTSPRFGWLTKSGQLLREYLLDKGIDYALEIISKHEDYCYPGNCACDTPCNNPLWEST